MSSMLAKWKSKDFLVVILLLQSMVYATVFFDVPVARQVIGFLYFTFAPGIVILKLLKLEHLEELETILFSMGLSVAFLMIAGLLTNEFGFLVGFSKPLSVMPLLIILNGFIFAGAVLACLRSENVKLWKAKNLGLSPSALLLFGLAVLSVLGAVWVNAFENNVILLFLMVAISLVFVTGVISEKLLPQKRYTIAVFVIAISLLYHSSLISNYIYGHDIHFEYFIFQTTQNNAYWSSINPYLGNIEYGRINSMLSVTILPTIYSSLLNMDSTWVFKTIFPLIFSFVPLSLYQLWKGYMRKKYAFISAFLFMAYATFYTEMLGLNRQIVAELFLVLLLLVVLTQKMKPPGKIVCFVIFSFGLVTSHYGVSEIFLFFISLTFISLFLAKKPSKNITASMVVLFLVVMFTWYIYTSSSGVFDSILQYSDFVYGQLGEFFNPASRGQMVLRGLGLESPPTILNAISRAFAYSTQFFIIVGFIGLLTKRVKVYFERDYLTFSSIAMAFLAALILLPGLANTLNMTRFYHILLFILAPLCILGAQFLVTFVFRRKKEIMASILLLTVLVPYFLFQTGFVYEVTGTESWSIPLSKYRMDSVYLYALSGFVDGQSVFGAQWMSKNVDTEYMQIYADWTSRYKVLTSYGMMQADYVNILSNTTKVTTRGVVYLSSLNVVYGKIISTGFSIRSSSEFGSLFSNLSKVYANGESELYISVPSG